MSKRYKFNSALSAALAASLLTTACANSGSVEPRKLSDFRDKKVKLGLATRALAAMQAKNYPLAVEMAEAAVDGTPNDAGFRALLGNAYFANGRFASAEQAYKDSLSIYGGQPQVALKLLLVKIGQGKNAEAVGFADTARAMLDPADYALAIALAGRPEAAIDVLRQVAERGGDARVRQNLALSYGLAGDWTNARVIASQDVPANQIDARIQQWMTLANPSGGVNKVAAMLGVTPAALDPGQPVRLALVKDDGVRTAQVREIAPTASVAAPAAVALAPIGGAMPAPPAAEPLIAVNAPLSAKVAIDAPAKVATTALAAVPVAIEEPIEMGTGRLTVKLPQARPALKAPAFTAMASVAIPIAAPHSAPAPQRSQEPKGDEPFAFVEVRKPAAPVAERPVKLASVELPARPAVPTLAAKKPASRSVAVVQLGAFSDTKAVERAWNAASKRHARLDNYRPMSALYRGSKGALYRLSVGGFDSTRDAYALCTSIKQSGGKCFVRREAGDKLIQLASL